MVIARETITVAGSAFGMGLDCEYLGVEVGGLQLRLRCGDFVRRGFALEGEDHAAGGAQRIAPADQSVEGSDGSRDHDVVGLMVIFGA